jgi:hypothetical protein
MLTLLEVWTRVQIFKNMSRTITNGTARNSTISVNDSFRFSTIGLHGALA